MNTGSPRAMARDSAARVITDGAGMLLGIVATVITARWLGPSGKGELAVLTLLGLLVARMATGGLGDAAIVLVGQRRVTRLRAVQATLAGMLPLSVAGVVIFAGVAIAQLQPSGTTLWIALTVVACTVPLGVFSDVLTHLLTMELRVVEASVVPLVTATVGTIGLAIFVAALDLGLTGAALAIAAGSIAGVALALFRLRGRLPGPSWDLGYLRQGLGYGLRLEASHLVTTMAGRVDLLIVYSLAGASDAGFYSIALTAGAMATLPSFAVAFAAFPRLAYISEDKWLGLTSSACRAGSGTAILVVVATCAVVPFAIPVLLGSGFAPAVIPTLILVVASLLWNAQWMLGRAAAARGRPNLLMASFGASLAVMLALDFALIPIAGTVGAALGAAVSYTVGLGVALRDFRQSGGKLRELVPEWRDIDPRSIRRRLLRPRDEIADGSPPDPLPAPTPTPEEELFTGPA